MGFLVSFGPIFLGLFVGAFQMRDKRIFEGKSTSFEGLIISVVRLMHDWLSASMDFDDENINNFLMVLGPWKETWYKAVPSKISIFSMDSSSIEVTNDVQVMETRVFVYYVTAMES